MFRIVDRVTIKKQRKCYSGKKKHHTLKTQIVVNKLISYDLLILGNLGLINIEDDQLHDY